MKLTLLTFTTAILSCINAIQFGTKHFPAAFSAPRKITKTSTTNNRSKQIEAGDKLPLVKVHWGFPPQYINIPEYCGGRNVIIVGLPGAFTSSKQVHSYVENQDELKKAGVEEVIFYCVNDAAVMGVWMHKLDLAGSMTQMFGDPSGAFTKALGMEMTHPGPVEVGLIGRSKRFALYVENNIVKYTAVSESEDDPTGDANSEETCAPAMIEAIKSMSENAIEA